MNTDHTAIVKMKHSLKIFYTMRRDGFLYLWIKLKMREMTKTITINLKGITHIIECWDDLQSLYKSKNYYEFAKKAQEFARMIISYDSYILSDLNETIEKLLKLTNDIVRKKKSRNNTIRKIKELIDYIVNIWCSNYLIDNFPGKI